MGWPLLANYATNKNLDGHLGEKKDNPKPPKDNHSYLSTPLLTEEQLVSAFRRFDGNGDGRLSRKELKNAFKSLGSRCPTCQSLAALYHADKNGDGYISEKEMNPLIQYALKCGYHVDE
ncbi:hypothetical protein PTKIN_Ptkin08bG0013400 [Pterospermum kingtungense]